MYRAHFGLRELPFTLTPDTSFFFSRSRYQEALNTLLIAVRQGEGFIKITGEVGIGKTLLCRKFMASLDQSFTTAYIPNPFLEPRSLMMAVADELGAVVTKDADQHLLLRSINHRLLVLAREGKRPVLCIDEAQALPVESLEAIRLLTNLETEKRKLLQIVMFGQPELDDKLQQDKIRQLNQRITFHYRLSHIAKDELASYLDHRMRVAGYTGESMFTPGAVDALYSASGGTLRLVNVLANKALMLCFGEGTFTVTAAHIRAAAKDTGAARIASRKKWLLLGCAALLVVGFLAWTYWK